MNEVNDVELPDWAENPERYRDALLAVSGGRDPLEILEQTPLRVRALIGGHAAHALERRPAAGEWTATEIIGHLLDDEIVFAFRLRLALTADQPSYPGNEPERWVALPNPPCELLLATWESLRSYNLWLLRGIPRAAWDRVGLHAEQGPETVEINIRKTAGHDLAHLSQLEFCLLG